MHGLFSFRSPWHQTNVLVDDDGQPLINDFDCSKILEEAGYTTAPKYKPARSAPPELYPPSQEEQDGDADFSADSEAEQQLPSESEEGEKKLPPLVRTKKGDVYSFSM